MPCWLHGKREQSDSCSLAQSFRHSTIYAALLLQGLADRLYPNTLVGRIGSRLVVQFRNLQAAAMVEADQVPFLVEHRASRTAALGRSAIVQNPVVAIQQLVVIDGERQPAPVRISDHIDAGRAIRQ